MSPSLTPSQTPHRGPLFPEGVYQQEVEIKVNVPEKSIHEDFSFHAVIKKKPQHFVMLAYNSFGISLFRIEDSPPQPLQWTCDLELLNQNKAFFLKIYPQIKKVFELKGTDLQQKDNYYLWKDQSFKIEFLSFDPNGYPIKMAMSDQKHYWITIINKK